ncbi:hypothetical protein [Streptacidiphilus rugosus]|uniref:hypothetical protein n=1 Tax=Streptacidiphilus rugosus TaxID=405783 RepID=UPI001E6518D4|nr:hypothetical protein [Streptacidiphilus rugosus]
MADCVEGLVRLEDLPVEPVVEGQELPVTILAVDLDRHRASLSAMRGRRAEGQMEEPIRMAELRCDARRFVG